MGLFTRSRMGGLVAMSMCALLFLTVPAQALLAVSNLVEGDTNKANDIFLVQLADNDPLVVNTTDDINDGTCDTQHCSLREAINTANSSGGATIHFDIPGSGVRSIQLTSGLPIISVPVVINGSSQPGYNGSPLIEINGSGTANANGLILMGGDSTLRGLIINHFTFQGVILQGSGGNLIVGNIIGTNVNNDTGIGNRDGVYIFNSSGNTVGGTTPADRNIISGNTDDGVNFEGPAAVDNVVIGNIIGTDLTGKLDLGNSGDGVKISNTSNDNVVGGSEPGAGNVIAFNHGRGVYSERDTTFATGNSVLGNSIYSNEGLGIDLDGDGVTANDAGDVDDGPNHLQNFPVLTQVETAAGSLNLSGTLNASSSATLHVEFFANDRCDASGNGEGKTFIGSVDATTDVNGDALIEVTFAVNVAADQWITATATDAESNTSEFSACVQVVAGVVSEPNAAPTRNYFTSHTPVLTWTGVRWATGYWIQIDQTSNFATPVTLQYDDLTAQALSKQLDALLSGVYFWRVRAKSATGAWGTWSAVDVFEVK